MSLKLCLAVSFLLVHLTCAQNVTFFGLQIPFIRDTYLTNNPIDDDVVILDTESATENPTILQDNVEHDNQHPSYAANNNQHTTKSPGWNNFFPTIDLNGLTAGLVKTKQDVLKLGLILITRTHCDNVREQHICKFTRTRYGVTDVSKLVKDSNFDIDRKTVIYFHGYEDNIDSDPTRRIIDAYLQRDDHNLFICDYHDLIAGKYVKQAVFYIQTIAPTIAHMIYRLSGKGFDVSLLHLVGHSIGAQMAGSVGKAFIELSEGTKLIDRITGLDPSFVFFYPPIGRHITAKDAHFVDIIHTDAWSYGAPVATGSVDFWPNGGSYTQPGCPVQENKILSKFDTSTCSHYRAVRFWAESLLTEHPFLAMKCPSWSKFKKNVCIPKNTAYMGYDAKPGITGNYYLQTNSLEPFTRKHHGIIYDNVD